MVKCISGFIGAFMCIGCFALSAELRPQEKEFIESARIGDTARMSALLKENPSLITVKGEEGWFPIHYTIFSRDRKAVLLLLNRGANVNAFTSREHTPLHIAAFMDQPDIAQLLIEKGANVQAITDSMATPLHWCAHRDAVAVAKLLIENGSSVNAGAQFNATPLHWAAQNGASNLVRVLLANRAEIDSQTDGGKTPAMLAAENNHHAIAKMLSNVSSEKASAIGPALPSTPNQSDFVSRPDAPHRVTADMEWPKTETVSNSSGMSAPTWVIENIAIADLTSYTLSVGEIKTLTDKLLGLLVKTGYFTVLSRSDAAEILKEQQFQRSGNCDDSACLIEMGKLLSVERIVGGSIGRVGSTYSIALRLVNAETGQAEISANRERKGDPDILLTLIGEVAEELATQYARIKRK